MRYEQYLKNKTGYSHNTKSRIYKGYTKGDETMIFTLSEAAELKKEIADILGIQLHFHDGCGGQYFSIESADETAMKKITEFFEKKNLRAVFFKDGMSFTVE